MRRVIRSAGKYMIHIVPTDISEQILPHQLLNQRPNEAMNENMNITKSSNEN